MTAEAKTPDTDGFAASPEPPAAPIAQERAGGTSPRKTFRSGYQRSKWRLQKLYAERDDLKLENDRLRQDVADLEAMFSEMQSLNNQLAADLRRARQRPSVPFSSTLMGVRHG